ncbi:hypothetical protein K9M18_04285 [Candidatus Woesearchaeota archaeon]|nr:hypothetical protein [Candidatus Woesearchaeota archaeon]
MLIIGLFSPFILFITNGPKLLVLIPLIITIIGSVLLIKSSKIANTINLDYKDKIHNYKKFNQKNNGYLIKKDKY